MLIYINKQLVAYHIDASVHIYVHFLLNTTSWEEETVKCVVYVWNV